MFLATGIFAMGDTRYYARKEFPDSHNGNPTTDAFVVSYFGAIETLSGAQLIAVQKSIMYDPSNIPPADPEIESRVKILLRFDDHITEQVEIPCLEPGTTLSKQALQTLLTPVTVSREDGPLQQVVKFDTPPERKGRGK